jgi:hypothetical protein
VPVDLSPLLQLGAVGAILAFFLVQTNPRLERVERALDFLSRTMLLDIVSRENIPEVNRRQAQSMLKQMNSKYKIEGES